MRRWADNYALLSPACRARLTGAAVVRLPLGRALGEQSSGVGGAADSSAAALALSCSQRLPAIRARTHVSPPRPPCSGERRRRHRLFRARPAAAARHVRRADRIRFPPLEGKRRGLLLLLPCPCLHSCPGNLSKRGALLAVPASSRAAAATRLPYPFACLTSLHPTPITLLQFCPGDQTEREALMAAVATWPPGVRPKVHWSESQVGVHRCGLCGMQASLCAPLPLQLLPLGSMVPSSPSRESRALELLGPPVCFRPALCRAPSSPLLAQAQAGRKPHAHSDYVRGPVALHGLEGQVDVMIEAKCKVGERWGGAGGAAPPPSSPARGKRCVSRCMPRSSAPLAAAVLCLAHPPPRRVLSLPGRSAPCWRTAATSPCRPSLRRRGREKEWRMQRTDGPAALGARLYASCLAPALAALCVAMDNWSFVCSSPGPQPSPQFSVHQPVCARAPALYIQQPPPACLPVTPQLQFFFTPQPLKKTRSLPFWRPAAVVLWHWNAFTSNPCKDRVKVQEWEWGPSSGSAARRQHALQQVAPSVRACCRRRERPYRAG